MKTQVFYEVDHAGATRQHPANSEKEAIEAGIVLLAKFGLGKANGTIWLYRTNTGREDPYKEIEVKNNRITAIY